MSEDLGYSAALLELLTKPPTVKKERSEEEKAVADGVKEDTQKKDGAVITDDLMALTVAEEYLSSPKGGEDLSADMGCFAAPIKTQSKPPMVDKERSEEQETVVHAAAETKQVMVLETELFDRKRSVVLQTLLRAPRYFDFRGSIWETCQRCGKENHGAASCSPLVKKKPPCFYCGHYGHNGKHCKKVTGCFICKRRGHLAKDCPDAKKQMLKDQSCQICLKCGDTGHHMFTCEDGYSSSDLEKVRCWVCKAFGHLCCIDYKDYRPRKVSCYNCGELGHLGSACLNKRGNLQSASLSCKIGRTGPSSNEGNNTADHALQEGNDGDRNLLCEESKFAKEKRNILGAEVASKRSRMSRWRRKRWQKKMVRMTEDGRCENGGVPCDKNASHRKNQNQMGY